MPEQARFASERRLAMQRSPSDPNTSNGMRQPRRATPAVLVLALSLLILLAAFIAACGVPIGFGRAPITPSPVCYPVTARADPGAGGTVNVETAPNCGSGYTADQTVSVRA